MKCTKDPSSVSSQLVASQAGGYAITRREAFARVVAKLGDSVLSLRGRAQERPRLATRHGPLPPSMAPVTLDHPWSSDVMIDLPGTPLLA